MKKNFIFFILTWKKFVFYSIFLYMHLLFDLRGESREKLKWRHNPILTFLQSFVKFQNMDPEMQMKDDGLQHIFIYATFVWPPRRKSWKRKMRAYPILAFTQSFIQFQMMVKKIQVKRAKRDIHTDQPSHRLLLKIFSPHPVFVSILTPVPSVCGLLAL